MSDVHPILLRASVRGLTHNDPNVIAAALLYDAIVHQRRFTEDDKVSHVAGCVLDVAMASTADDVTHLAGSIFMVSTFPLDFATYPVEEWSRSSSVPNTTPGDVGAEVARALAKERFGGTAR